MSGPGFEDVDPRMRARAGDVSITSRDRSLPHRARKTNWHSPVLCSQSSRSRTTFAVGRVRAKLTRYPAVPLALNTNKLCLS